MKVILIAFPIFVAALVAACAAPAPATTSSTVLFGGTTTTDTDGNYTVTRPPRADSVAVAAGRLRRLPLRLQESG